MNLDKSGRGHWESAIAVRTWILFIATLGTNPADPTTPNGKVIRVDVASKTVTSLGGPIFSDGLTYRPPPLGGGEGTLLVGDLWTRKIYQLGGMDWSSAYIGFNRSLFVTMYGAGRPGILRVR